MIFSLCRLVVSEKFSCSFPQSLAIPYWYVKASSYETGQKNFAETAEMRMMVQAQTGDSYELWTIGQDRVSPECSKTFEVSRPLEIFPFPMFPITLEHARLGTGFLQKHCLVLLSRTFFWCCSFGFSNTIPASNLSCHQNISRFMSLFQ